MGDLRARLKRLEKFDKRASAEIGCICFPSDEPPQLELKAEVESARSVLCPLHGERFAKVAPAIWRVVDLPAHLNQADWKRHSAHYVRAMKSSFPPDRFPAARVEGADGSIRFVLKDGVEIHRIGPPTEVYDYDTGKLVGHAGPTGRFVPLDADPVVEPKPSKMDDVVIPV
jgi:hypothetical protein